jgi:hypothetical protein
MRATKHHGLSYELSNRILGLEAAILAEGEFAKQS